jgi:hypothetical protein
MLSTSTGNSLRKSYVISHPGSHAGPRRNSLDYVGMLLSHDLIAIETVSLMGCHKQMAFIRFMQKFSLAS